MRRLATEIPQRGMNGVPSTHKVWNGRHVIIGVGECFAKLGNGLYQWCGATRAMTACKVGVICKNIATTCIDRSLRRAVHNAIMNALSLYVNKMSLMTSSMMG